MALKSFKNSRNNGYCREMFLKVNGGMTNFFKFKRPLYQISSKLFVPPIIT